MRGFQFGKDHFSGTPVEVTLLPLALGAPWEACVQLPCLLLGVDTREHCQVARRCVIRSASYSSNVGNGNLASHAENLSM